MSCQCFINVLSPNVGKYWTEYLEIWTAFTQLQLRRLRANIVTVIVETTCWGYTQMVPENVLKNEWKIPMSFSNNKKFFSGKICNFLTTGFYGIMYIFVMFCLHLYK